MLYLFLFLLMSCNASSNQEQLPQNEQNVQQNQEEDVWLGPGFYYGIWFDQEEDYWYWRKEHPEYPPNRAYYDANHPVYYQDKNHPYHEEAPHDHYEEAPREGARPDEAPRAGGGGRR